MYDIVIIGAGVVGCAIARKLSQYHLNVAVIDKHLDVGMETSSRNSGVIHSGIHYQPGSLRARLNVHGNTLMSNLCKALKVKIDYIGKMTIAQDSNDLNMLHKLKEQGEANGVPGLEILNKEKMESIQPGIGGIQALYSPSTSIICPYGLTIALAENSIVNGIKFNFGCNVNKIERNSNGFIVKCANGKKFTSPLIINSAGLYADRICRMVGINEYRIYPCRGEYLILDKRLQDKLSILVYPAPRKDGAGLGIHLTSTVDGNILIGPSNEYIEDPNDCRCTYEIMAKLKEKGHDLLSNLSTEDIIRSFSGVRPKQTPPEKKGFRDFIIENRQDVPGFINLVGIESPGLTCSPAIALTVREMVAQIRPIKKKETFIDKREGIVGYFNDLPEEAKADLVAQNSDYGEIVCRCEGITKKEILDAIDNPLGVRTISAIKYRSRALMGRCQGGFCLPRITNILENDFGYKPEDYFLFNEQSPLYTGYVRNR